MNREAARKSFRHQTGRVIALGRAYLAALFLEAVWLDPTRPLPAPGPYLMLGLYVVFALAITALTWRNWWLDARLAAPAMFVDIAMFVLIVFSTDGYASPFYLIFTLPLLTAAIRWSWRDTARIAILLVTLYLAAGFLVAGTGSFEMQRFILRSGHLMILSVLLIWFGVHQLGTPASAVLDYDPVANSRRNPLEAALGAAVAATGAGRGGLVLLGSPREPYAGVQLADGEFAPALLQAGVIRLAPGSSCRLYDLPRDRSLGKTDRGWSDFGRAGDIFDRRLALADGFVEGLVAPVSTGTATGFLFLEQIPDLSTDYIALGQQLGRSVGAFLDREALAEAVAIGAGTRERLSLARDVHDSLVQFLAGAAFRVEAMARAAKGGRKLDTELAELKRLIVEEQADMREFVAALRRDRDLRFGEAVEDLVALAAKLSKQWALDCHVHARQGAGTIPIRLHLDVRQLLREAVANAARHGSARKVEVDVKLRDEQLDLQFVDDGSGFAKTVNGAEFPPWSLKERVDRAGGTLTIDTAPGRTAIAVRLPLEGTT